MRSKRSLHALSGVLCTLFCLTVPARAVSTSAQAAVLMDAASGRVLYTQNAYESRSIASVTKLMTALVCVESCPDLDQEVTVDPGAVGVEGSSIYLKPQERLTLRELLYGLLLHSGNDAAMAIALHVSGSVEAFAGKMNATAQRLGMVGSHFDNPSGLEGAAHYSTAYDLALLAQAVLAQPELAKIVATRTITIGSRTFTNHNKLLWQYEGCVGMKTGFTKKAGRTLVSAAHRNGGTLIAVTLNDGNDWVDHAALLDYGFTQYPPSLLCRPGKPLATVAVAGSLTHSVTVITGQEVRYPLAAGETVTAHIDLPVQLSAPLEQGQSVGSITFFQNGVAIGRSDLLCTQSVPDDRPARCKGLLGVFRPLTMGLWESQAPRWLGAVSMSAIWQGA